MVDMHIHSTNSDGTKTVIELLKEAEKLGLSAISFTDHESCGAYDELERIDVSKIFSGRIIKGIELKCQYNDMVIDILGYGIDHVKMKQQMKECYKNASRGQIQEIQLREFYEIGKRMNLSLRPIEELQWDKNKDWGSLVFYNEMKSHPENKERLPEDIWEDFANFRRNHYNVKGDIFYINRAKNYPTLEQIANAIHSAGGKVFVAHIYEYKQIQDKIAELEEMTSKFDIDGVECYHSIFTKENIISLLEFTKNHRLLVSGGSDYHGKVKPDIELGTGRGILNIPDRILENWNVDFVSYEKYRKCRTSESCELV